jgi:hypothetical protein
MRAIKHLSVLFAVLALVLTMGNTVAAQDSTPEGDPFDIANLEGVQYGGLRTYTVDFESMMASPSADMEMPTGVLALIGGVMEFDNDDNAEKAFDAVADDALKSLTEQEGGGNAEEIDLDLGNKSKAYSISAEESGMSVDGVVGFVQEDNYLYVVGVSGSEIDAEQLTKDFGQKLIDNDANDDDEQFNADGTSTGGVWNKFPGSDDDLVKGLIPTDEQLYPETES